MKDYVDCYTRICHYNIVLTEKDTGFGARGPFEKFCLDSVALSESNEVYLFKQLSFCDSKHDLEALCEPPKVYVCVMIQCRCWAICSRLRWLECSWRAVSWREC